MRYLWNNRSISGVGNRMSITKKEMNMLKEHKKWYLKTIGMAYLDALIHGFKHGKEAGLKCIR